MALEQLIAQYRSEKNAEESVAFEKNLLVFSAYEATCVEIMGAELFAELRPFFEFAYRDGEDLCGGVEENSTGIYDSGGWYSRSYFVLRVNAPELRLSPFTLHIYPQASYEAHGKENVVSAFLDLRPSFGPGYRLEVASMTDPKAYHWGQILSFFRDDFEKWHSNTEE